MKFVRDKIGILLLVLYYFQCNYCGVMCPLLWLTFHSFDSVSRSTPTFSFIVIIIIVISCVVIFRVIKIIRVLLTFISWNIIRWLFDFTIYRIGCNYNPHKYLSKDSLLTREFGTHKRGTHKGCRDTQVWCEVGTHLRLNLKLSPSK